MLRDVVEEAWAGATSYSLSSRWVDRRQIVHHMADNDMNAYLRFKRALTEDEPMGSSYREDLWAELSDYRDVPIETRSTRNTP